MRWKANRFPRIASILSDTLNGRRRRRFAVVPHLARRPDGSEVWIWLEWAWVWNDYGPVGDGSIRCWEVDDEK